MKYSQNQVDKIVDRYRTVNTQASITNPFVVEESDSGWLNGNPYQCFVGDVVVTLNDLQQVVIGSVL